MINLSTIVCAPFGVVTIRFLKYPVNELETDLLCAEALERARNPAIFYNPKPRIFKVVTERGLLVWPARLTDLSPLDFLGVFGRDGSETTLCQNDINFKMII